MIVSLMVTPTGTGTAALPAMRSVVCAPNVNADTHPTMNLYNTAADAAAPAAVDTVTVTTAEAGKIEAAEDTRLSDCVGMVTFTAPAVKPPKVKPPIVTVTARLDMMAR